MKNKSTLRIIFLFILITFARGSQSQNIKVSAQSGDWTNALTWSPAGVPDCGDSVVISSNHTVTVNSQLNYFATCTLAMKLVVYGQFHFTHGFKLKLPCGSYVVIYPGGSLDPDDGFASSNYIEICGTVEWNANTTLNGPACLPLSSPFCQAVLPVELTGLRALECENGKVCLNWETASEKNNDYFQAERSGDGINFTVIGTIHSSAPGGNSRQTLSYSITDSDPVPGDTYYRVRQVDLDRTSSTSAIVHFKPNRTADVQLVAFPTPNSGEFNIRITGLRQSEHAKVYIRNAAGELIWKNEFFIEQGFTQLRIIPGRKIPQGVYICSVLTSSGEYMSRVVINGL